MYNTSVPKTRQISKYLDAARIGQKGHRLLLVPFGVLPAAEYEPKLLTGG